MMRPSQFGQGEPTTDEVLDVLACANPRCPCNGPRRHPNHLTHCPLHDDAHPSLSVSGRDGRTQVHCFAGCDQEATWREVRGIVEQRRPGTDRLLRIAGSAAQPDSRPTPEAAEPRSQENPNGGRAHDADHLVQSIWKQSQPDRGRVAGYLRSRGLADTVPAALRYHPGLPYDRSRQFPAMVAGFRRLDGGIVGLHRTFLDSQGDGKAPVQQPKKFLGQIRGAAIRLAEPEGEHGLDVTEGIETGLAVMQATEAAVWVAGSAAGMANLDLPAELDSLRIWADPDRAGLEKGAYRLAERAASQGCRVYLLVPDRENRDWLDVLGEEGADTLRRAREDAARWLPANQAAVEGKATDIPDAHRGDDSASGDRSSSGRPEIKLHADTAETATWHLTVPGCPEVRLTTRKLRSWEEVEVACNDIGSVPRWRPKSRYEWQQVLDGLIPAAHKEKVDEEFTAVGNFRRILARFCHNPEEYPDVLDQEGVLRDGDSLCFRGESLLNYIAGLPGDRLDRLQVYAHLRELGYRRAWKRVDGRLVRVISISGGVLLGDTEKEAPDEGR
jgi:hypothetical protein